MNQFFLHWVDLFAMVLSLTLAIVYTIRLHTKAADRLRPLALFFLLFGPLVIAVHMSMHLFEISYHAVENALTGTFQYNYRFYSLILMGGLIWQLSIHFMRKCVNFYVKQSGSKKEVLKAAGVIALVSVPTIPFTPIGSLPVMACAITLISSIFIKRKRPVYKALDEAAMRQVMTQPSVVEQV
jgi:hypothetical protein